MAENMEQILKSFNQRAAEAEERLAKLEALLANIMLGAVDTESSASTIKELQSKLETAQSELQSEREKASKEIQKLEYRILLLVRALREADSKLASLAVK
ncbi:uncharacterized protein LOC120273390 isoform X2 [Dioscorea cayenensis subsp. rotundata]|uniref:Uncharacterized protein LOC120273390 isoform X2 n=1 Tax=Dioscorea cayennensis subsp. rotundata TaxID=55577 RepID=A0AB40C7X6_DIOCR|nr:uncharacterized protein LOC120273390 isoform X2 [Dioscorea cayenensis subsp. rotundata]